MSAGPRPRVITKSDPTRVEIEWEDGERSLWSARQLRQACPCASCVDEVTGRRILDPDSVADDTRTRDVVLVGNYALSILFSDGHSTGIYPWRMLREKAPESPETSEGSGTEA